MSSLKRKVKIWDLSLKDLRYGEMGLWDLRFHIWLYDFNLFTEWFEISQWDLIWDLPITAPWLTHRQTQACRQTASGVISANHWGSNISYSTTSLSPCYCDVWYAKQHLYRIGSALLYHRKKTLQKVTVTVMVNDCTTISISEQSTVFKYYVVKNTDCHLSLRVVQNFYTSKSLGVHRPLSPINR